MFLRGKVRLRRFVKLWGYLLKCTTRRLILFLMRKGRMKLIVFTNYMKSKCNSKNPTSSQYSTSIYKAWSNSARNPSNTSKVSSTDSKTTCTNSLTVSEKASPPATTSTPRTVKTPSPNASRSSSQTQMCSLISLNISLKSTFTKRDEITGCSTVRFTLIFPQCPVTTENWISSVRRFTLSL